MKTLNWLTKYRNSAWKTTDYEIKTGKPNVLVPNILISVSVCLYYITQNPSWWSANGSARRGMLFWFQRAVEKSSSEMERLVRRWFMYFYSWY